MRPMPWSYTSLDDFVNCPKAFYEKRVIKSVVEEQSEQMLWGNQVHSAFEHYVKSGKSLPDILQMHEPYLQKLATLGDQRHTEKKIALNLKGKPCGFFDKDVWFRGVIDYHALEGDTAHVVDYKTGKPHTKFEQLKLFALWILSAYPHIDRVKTCFYWTQTMAQTSHIVERQSIPQVWGEFTPNLRQYAQAFKQDIWQPRQSGLCNGWCPVTSCEFWKPKRRR